MPSLSSAWALAVLSFTSSVLAQNVQTCRYDPVWNPCNGKPNYDCATFLVPEDWSNQSRGERPLNLIRIPARDANGNRISGYADSIVINPGGPGSSGLQAILEDNGYYRSLVGPNYHIVGFDPRGVGVNKIYNCASPATGGPGIDYSEQSTINDAYSYASATANKCDAEWGDNGSVQKIGSVSSTAQVARDVEAISRKLNSDQMIRYWGFSYGTVLGDTIAKTFPDRIARMVLDGNINPNDYYFQFPVEEATDIDAGVANFFGLCASANVISMTAPAGIEGCAWVTPAGAARTNASLIQKFDNWVGAKPNEMNRGRVANDTGYLLNIEDSWLARRFMFNILKRPDLFIKSSQILQYWYENPAQIQVLNPDKINEYTIPAASTTATATNAKRQVQATGIADSNGDFNPDTTFTGNNELIGITCADNQFRPKPLSGTEYKDYLDQYNNKTKYAGEFSVQIFYSCAPWLTVSKFPFAAGDRFANIKTSTPILFVQTTYDPVTPAISGKSAAAAFLGSYYIESNGAGHCSNIHPSTLLNDAVRAYWMNATAPTQTQFIPDEPNPFQSKPTTSAAPVDGNGGEQNGGTVQNSQQQRRDIAAMFPDLLVARGASKRQNASPTSATLGSCSNTTSSTTSTTSSTSTTTSSTSVTTTTSESSSTSVSSSTTGTVSSTGTISSTATGSTTTGTASTGTASTGTISTGTASTGTASTSATSTSTTSTGTASTGTSSTNTASTGTTSTGTASTNTASTNTASTVTVSTGTASSATSSTNTASINTASTGTASTNIVSTSIASTTTASTGTASTGTASTGTASTGTLSTGTASMGTATTGTSSTSTNTKSFTGTTTGTGVYTYVSGTVTYTYTGTNSYTTGTGTWIQTYTGVDTTYTKTFTGQESATKSYSTGKALTTSTGKPWPGFESESTTSTDWTKSAQTTGTPATWGPWIAGPSYTWPTWTSQSDCIPVTKTVCGDKGCSTGVVAIPTKTVYVDWVQDVCETGLTTKMVTITATCNKGCDSKPTGVPQGFITSKVYCSACAVPSDVIVTVKAPGSGSNGGNGNGWGGNGGNGAANGNGNGWNGNGNNGNNNENNNGGNGGNGWNGNGNSNNNGNGYAGSYGNGNSNGANNGNGWKDNGNANGGNGGNGGNGWNGNGAGNNNGNSNGNGWNGNGNDNSKPSGPAANPAKPTDAGNGWSIWATTTSSKPDPANTWAAWNTAATGKSSTNDWSAWDALASAAGKPADPATNTWPAWNSPAATGASNTWAAWESPSSTGPKVAKYTGGAVANTVAYGGILAAVFAGVFVI